MRGAIIPRVSVGDLLGLVGIILFLVTQAGTELASLWYRFLLVPSVLLLMWWCGTLVVRGLAFSGLDRGKARVIIMVVGGAIVGAAMFYGVSVLDERHALARQPGSLRGLSNAQLEAHAKELAGGLRALEHRYQTRQMELLDFYWAQRGTNVTPDEARQRWNRQNQESERISREEKEEYKRELRPRALRLRDECLRRNPKTSVSATLLPALDANMLAGVNPLGNVADYLERLGADLR